MVTPGISQTTQTEGASKLSPGTSDIISFPRHTPKPAVQGLPCIPLLGITGQDVFSLGLPVSFAGYRVSQADFCFTEQVGRSDWTTLSPQRDVMSHLQATTKKCSCFLKKICSPPHFLSRGMFSPWKWRTGGGKAEQVG